MAGSATMCWPSSSRLDCANMRRFLPLFISSFYELFRTASSRIFAIKESASNPCGRGCKAAHSKFRIPNTAIHNPQLNRADLPRLLRLLERRPAHDG
jgi:hypothetical protein